MNHCRQNNIIKILFIFAFSILLFAEETYPSEPWKIDIQILLGFSEKQVDGIMGKATFEALKSFAIEHELQMLSFVVSMMIWVSGDFSNIL